jgi:predicted RNA-binding Zn-ribbon protein involved in translation (DUF1610 family)
MRSKRIMPEPVPFKCPNCQTRYKVVRVEAPPTPDRPLTCLSCGAPLRNREGKFALKYFRTDGRVVLSEKKRLF